MKRSASAEGKYSKSNLVVVKRKYTPSTKAIKERVGESLADYMEKRNSRVARTERSRM